MYPTMVMHVRRGWAEGEGAADIERIDTRKKNALGKTMLLVLALAVTAVAAIFFYAFP